MSIQVRAVPTSVNGWNPEYLDAEYQRYKSDPSSVPSDLQAFFRGFELAGSGSFAGAGGGGGDARFALRVAALIQSYRSIGHLAAAIDPLGRARPRPAELSLEHHGLSEADLDRPVERGDLHLPEVTTLRRLVQDLEKTYCGATGFEVMHIKDEGQRRWLLQRIESTLGRISFTAADRRHILEQLLRAEEFENFLQMRYSGDKRFSVEGGESLVPLLDRLIEAGGELGVEEMVLGMAHRGRLTVLNTIMGKSYEQIFTEFEDSYMSVSDPGGDVKYHKGYSGVRPTRKGPGVHLAMASNPSHLEAVNPVVLGRARAKQRLRGDHEERRRVVPVLIHGDAAVAGQGVVAECVNMSDLEGYRVGGCVHVVTNNMIGFTTLPTDGRTGTYCTDVGKMVDSPAMHVNGEDPEAVVSAAQIAMEYRQQFRRDVWVDMYCFRKYGHNEQDEPMFTQPLLYSLIKKKAGVMKVYAERLLAEGAITEQDMTQLRERLKDVLNTAQETARKKSIVPDIDPGGARWAGMKDEFTLTPVKTAVDMSVLEEVCAAMGRHPDHIEVHPRIKQLMEARAALPKTKTISYADGESLAFGTLLLEGTAVRISGQDCRRGTFAHRHAVIRDLKTNEPYTPLNHMREVGNPGTATPPLSKGADGKPRQAKLCVYDSPLSEYAVMGFDYGYSLADPNMLVCWEAQFGDFCNGAQIAIDQFISSADIKWGRWSGMVLLLPHGQQGLGPEHSSARLERFLQLCGDDCMQVAFPTTGAQIFHLLRRQIHRNFRKTLTIMTPKVTLRLPTSTIEELTTGTFQEMLDDPTLAAADRKNVKRVILCSGNFYFELSDRREKLGRKDVAIIRIEQLYPFHHEMLAKILAGYPKSAELVYVQEEPRNQGAYLFVADLLRQHLGIKELAYIGRETSASPSTGSKNVYKATQEAVIAKAIGSLPETKEPKAGGKAAKVGA